RKLPPDPARERHHPGRCLRARGVEGRLGDKRHAHQSAAGTVMSLLPPPRRRRKPDFSLTTVNIVFLLLLFYLATGSLIKKSELETDIPVTEELPLERLPRPL